MPNSINYSSIFTQNLDKLIEQTATTSWMTANASRVKYNGGDEFKLAVIGLDALSDYDRADGFATGAISFDWKTYTFDYDRGRKFRIDAMDTDETNFVLDASTAMGEFVRTKVVPEVDMVRLAKLAGYGSEVPANASGAIATLKDAIIAIRNTGYDGQLVAHVSFDFLRKLEDDLSDKLGVINFNGIDFPALQDTILIPTVADRLVSAVKKDGTTKVISKADNAVDLELIITGVEVPLGIVKHNPFKVINPEANQEADAYDVHYRLYHTLVVEYNKTGIVKYVVKNGGSF